MQPPVDNRTGACKKPRKREIPRWLKRLRTLCLCVILGLALPLIGYYLYVRVLHNNFHVVVQGRVYRSAQPSPQHLREWKRKYGLRSIINLRGESAHDYFLAEKDAAKDLDLQLCSIRFSAQDLPPRPFLLDLAEAIETLPQPILLHCAEGADRTGLASVMAAMAIGNQSFQDARDQLSARFFHLSPDPEHIGGLMDLYQQWCQSQGKPTGGWEQFLDYTKNHYHVKYYYVRIEAPEQLTLQPGRVQAVPVRIRNISDSVLPAANPEQHFTIAAFLGSSMQQRPDAELASRVDLPRKDLPPGAQVERTLHLRAPAEPGVYRVKYDLVEEHVTWFARQGSPVAETKLIVTEPDATAAERPIVAGSLAGR